MYNNRAQKHTSSLVYQTQSTLSEMSTGVLKNILKDKVDM